MPTITEDKIAIQEVMYRYALMVDNHRWHMMDDIFAADATVDYVSSGGQKGPYKETLGWLERALKPWPAARLPIKHPWARWKMTAARP